MIAIAIAAIVAGAVVANVTIICRAATARERHQFQRDMFLAQAQD